MHNSCVTVLIRVMSCRVFIAIQSFFFKCYCQKGRKVVDLFDETLLFKVSSFPAAAAFFFFYKHAQQKLAVGVTSLLYLRRLFDPLLCQRIYYERSVVFFFAIQTPCFKRALQQIEPGLYTIQVNILLVPPRLNCLLFFSGGNIGFLSHN